MKKYKVIQLIFLLSVFSTSKLFSQNIYSATYSVSYMGDSSNQLLSVFLNGVVYKLSSNGKYSVLNASIQDSEIRGLELVTSGPTTTFFDIRNNLVKLNSIEDTLFQYDPISFKSVKQDTIVNNYKCEVLVNSNNDILYVSKKLPSYINPFYLNSDVIKFGIVKAELKGSGTYTLTQFEKTNSMQSLSFPKEKATKKTSNPFF